MAKCPVCGNEYEDVCRICSPEPEGGEASRGNRPEGLNAPEIKDGAVLLTTVGDNFEASLIETRLKQNGIPVMLKYRENGAYLSFYMGKTSFGVDIYVPAALFEDARALVSPTGDADSNETPEEEAGETADEAREDYRKRIEFRSWLVFGAIFLVICALIAVSFLSK